MFILTFLILSSVVNCLLSFTSNSLSQLNSVAITGSQGLFFPFFSLFPSGGLL